MPGVWARYTDLVIDRGEGSWLITTDGERYLDYTSGIGVTNTGHAHPAVSAAIAAQAVKLLHGQQNIVYHEAGLRLHARLAALAPAPGWGAFLANSGAEAVEAAVKLARVATGRPVVVAFRGGFHGRTAQTMSLTTSRVTVRADFEPLPGSVYHAPYPDPYRGGGDDDALRLTWERAMASLFAQLVDPRRVAAFIIEPVIGEGGYIVPPAWFLPRLRELATQHGILLIADEVQTGFGRTGRFWAIEHWDVVPDIIVMAKGIASGLPLSGILAPRETLARWAPGCPRRHVRRQRRGVCGGPGDASMSSSRRAWWRTPRRAVGSCWTAAARSRRRIPGWATCAAWAPWWPSSSWTRTPPTR